MTILAWPFTDTFEARLSDAVNWLKIHPEAESPFYYDYEVADVYYQGFQPILDYDDKPMFRVVEMDNDSVSVDCGVTIALGIACPFEFSVRDAVDRDYVIMGDTTEDKDIELETSVLVTGRYRDHGEGLDVTITHLEITEQIDRVDFGYVEPDWGVEDEFDRLEDLQL